MRIFGVYAGAVIAFTANAASAAFVDVGTYVQYKTRIDRAGVPTEGTVKISILQCDSPNKQYRTKTEFTSLTESNSSEEWYSEENVNSGANVLARCGDMGGVEQDVTVPAGTFKTCFFIQEEPAKNFLGQYWIGDVPFNIVKSIETSDKQAVEMVLQEAK